VPEASAEPSFRRATGDDLDAIVRMLANDPLGAARETYSNPLPESYRAAFEAIRGDRNNELVVACRGEAVVGVLQLTFIPYLTYRGGWRALVEGVRVDEGVRGSGVGRALIEWAIARARERGCHVVQLTTDKTRLEARAFYEKLGFAATHEGMKLHLAGDMRGRMEQEKEP
jgi:GNAT superfamily N-acetyltransferase